MAKVYFSLGSNQGDRLTYLVEAIQHIEKRVGKVLSFSEVFESEPWGFDADTNFYNMAIIAETELSPEHILEIILQTEKAMGRLRSGAAYSSREIDVDILFYDTLILKSDSLTIPHPRLHKRKFVLEPLAGIAPDYMHPVLQTTIAVLNSRVDNDSLIKIVAPKPEIANLLTTQNNI